MKRGVLASAMVMAMALSLSPHARAQRAVSHVPIVLHALAPNVYWATDSSNVGVIVGTDGVVVFDATGSTGRAHELLAAIATITDKPVKAVILSHSDGDHVAGLTGFPAGIRIIAQTRTAGFLAQSAAAGHPVAANRLPDETVADRKDMTLAGVRLRLLHWGPAHTDGDLVAYLPDQKIVFAGDIFCMDQPRALIKPDRHGSSAGWIATARKILALDATQIVSGHGGVESRADLEPLIQASATERDRIKALAAKGETLSQIESEVGEPQPAGSGSAFQAHFAQVVFGELTQKP